MQLISFYFIIFYFTQYFAFNFHHYTIILKSLLPRNQLAYVQYSMSLSLHLAIIFTLKYFFIQLSKKP